MKLKKTEALKMNNIRRILYLLTILSLVAGGSALAKGPKEPFTEPYFNVTDVPQKKLKQKILIEETGEGIHILIKSAQLLEISSLNGGSTPDLLKVKIFGQEYKIHRIADARVLQHSWGSSDLSEFSVGDIINAFGTLDSTDPFLVHAKTIRNVSFQFKHRAFGGEITQIPATSSASPAVDFILRTEARGDQKVIITEKTKILEGKVQKTVSDLQVGMRVMVRGLWNRTLSEIKALIIKIKPTEVTP